MRKIWTVSLAVIAAVASMGCTSISVGPSFIEAEKPSSNGEQAVVYVYRKNAEPRAINAAIYLGEKKVADLPQGTFTWFKTTSRQINIRSEWPWSSGQIPADIYIQPQAGGVYYVELTGKFQFGSLSAGMASFNKHSDLRLSTASTAKEQLTACCSFVRPLLSN